MAVAKVLLVEDEFLIRIIMAECLKDEGFEVVEASNAIEAISLLDDASTFDVLLTDVRMPGRLDGVDVALHARQLNTTVPVLVVSADPTHLVRRLEEFKPPAVFIRKPYALAEIVSALTNLTGLAENDGNGTMVG